MLSDDETAVAYAHLMDAMDAWGMLLDCVFETILPEEEPILKNMTMNLTKTLEILEP